MIDFLTLKPEVFGIDISDLSLKIIKLKKKGGSLALASLAETIKKSLTQIKGEKLKTKYVVASLPEEKSFLQVIQMPPMREEEMNKAVYFEAENYIPMPVEKVYLDAQKVLPALNHLDHLDVLIAALPRKTSRWSR